MECNKESMNAMNADVQAMTEGEVKKTVMKEMQMAQEMMRKKDMKGCMSHMRNAMEPWRNSGVSDVVEPLGSGRAHRAEGNAVEETH